ncbi:MAG: hypothetical protein AAFS12_00225 [Cyanobacteria bacterium J06632_19]
MQDFIRLCCLNIYFNSEYDKTLKLYSNLPALARHLKRNIPEHFYRILIDKYVCISIWLNRWDKKISVKDLKKSRFKSSEKKALTTLHRYKIVYELEGLGILEKQTLLHPNLPLISHNFVWFLWELSILLGEIDRGNKQKTGILKSNYYIECKTYIDNYEDFEKLETTLIKESELLNNFDSYFQALVKQTAIDNPDFDQEYFRPYTKALRRENSHGKKNEDLHTIKPPVKNKPGRKFKY